MNIIFNLYIVFIVKTEEDRKKTEAIKKVSVMRILLANLTKMVGDTGGLAKVTAAFANEMQRRDHEVSLVSVSYTHLILT